MERRIGHCVLGSLELFPQVGQGEPLFPESFDRTELQRVGPLNPGDDRQCFGRGGEDVGPLNPGDDRQFFGRGGEDVDSVDVLRGLGADRAGGGETGATVVAGVGVDRVGDDFVASEGDEAAQMVDLGHDGVQRGLEVVSHIALVEGWEEGG